MKRPRFRVTTINNQPYILLEILMQWRVYIGRDMDQIVVNYSFNPPQVKLITDFI